MKKIKITGIIFMIPLFMGLNIPHTKLQEGKKTTPNVIIIFMDDMGYGDVGVYERHQYKTPQIDALASEGMRFTDFYAAQAVCSASRAALLTGCYPNRIGISGALFPWSTFALNNNEATIASMLKSAGYKTSMVGKWHLGQQEPYLPLNYGFDEYLGLPYSNDMWPVGFDEKPITDSADFRKRYPPLPLLDGNNPVRFIQTRDDQGTLTKAYTDRAIAFIEKNKKEKFFLYMAHSLPHVPIAASPAFKGKSGSGLFGDMMEELDWSVGEIMITLKKNKLLENTLVIFTSDNGPWLSFGNHAGSSGGLREGKGTAWDGGVKEPFIISWKGKIKPGQVCTKLGVNIDLLPTIASLCKAALPKNKIDGVDISSLFYNPGATAPRDEFAYYYDRNSLKALRKGKWKIVFPHTSQTYLNPGAIGNDGFPGKTAQVKVPLALYDLEKDPAESTDLQASFPDIVKNLTAIADRYREALGDDLTNRKLGTENRAAAIVKPRW
jgi:arylsulfatase